MQALDSSIIIYVHYKVRHECLSSQLHIINDGNHTKGSLFYRNPLHVVVLFIETIEVFLRRYHLSQVSMMENLNEMI